MYDLPCSVYLLSLAGTLRTRKVHVYFLSRAHAFLPSLFGVFEFSHKRFKNEEGSCSISFYLPCLVYLLSLTSALRTRKVHVYFLSPVQAFLPSLFSLFAFSPASALRTRKVHVYFLSPVHAFSAFPVRSICFLSRKCFKNEEGSCSISFYLPCSVYLLSLASASRTRKVHVVFPFSCTCFSTFPVRSHHYSTLPVSQIDFL